MKTTPSVDSARIQSNLRSFVRTTLKTSCMGNILTQGHTSFFGRTLTAEANELSAHIIVTRCKKKLNDYCNCVVKCYARQPPRNRQVIYEIRSFEPPWEPDLLVQEFLPPLSTLMAQEHVNPKLTRMPNAPNVLAHLELHGMDLHANLIPIL